MVGAGFVLTVGGRAALPDCLDPAVVGSGCHAVVGLGPRVDGWTAVDGDPGCHARVDLGSPTVRWTAVDGCHAGVGFGSPTVDGLPVGCHAGVGFGGCQARLDLGRLIGSLIAVFILQKEK